MSNAGEGGKPAGERVPARVRAGRRVTYPCALDVIRAAGAPGGPWKVANTEASKLLEKRRFGPDVGKRTLPDVPCGSPDLDAGEAKS